MAEELSSYYTSRYSGEQIDQLLTGLSIEIGGSYANLAAIQAAFPNGDTAKYQAADTGNVYTWNSSAQEWQSLGPIQGPIGIQGETGKSAYQYAVDGGYTGTEAEFKAMQAGIDVKAASAVASAAAAENSKAAAAVSAQTAMQYSKKPPVILGGTWWIWDATAQDYVDTGIMAQGARGDSSIPVGSIMLWYGTEDTVPDGWQICDGTNGTPNLLGEIVRGAECDADVGKGDGSDTANVPYSSLKSASHSHKLSNSTLNVLTVNNTTTKNVYVSTYSNSYNSQMITIPNAFAQGASYFSVKNLYSYNTGANTATSGNLSIDIRPHTVRLYYIMRVSVVDDPATGVSKEYVDTAIDGAITRVMEASY